MLMILYQFDQIQWWPPDRIVAHQMEQISSLLSYAVKAIPFYRDRVEAAGIDLGVPLTPELFRKIPILSRADAQDAGEQLLSGKPPEDHGRTAERWTSGSTGRPLKIMTTEWTHFIWDAVTNRDHTWHGRDMLGRHGAILGPKPGQSNPPGGKRHPTWGSSADPAFLSGPAFTFDSSRPMVEQLRWLQEVKPDYLMTYPANLAELARLSLQEGVRIDSLRHARTQGEMLSPEQRDIVRRAWGVEIYDLYSSVEVGYAALQAPGAEHYLVQSEVTYLEVLNDDGEPCQPGEIGRVVVTPLHNFASPLIRYAVGDYAEMGGPAPCGRGLPVLSRVLGRVRNMLIRPDGSRSWPYFGGDQLMEIAPVRQFQIVQRSLEEVEVRIVATQSLSLPQQTALIQHIGTCLGGDFKIRLRYLDKIERHRSGKYEDFRCEVADAGPTDQAAG